MKKFVYLILILLLTIVLSQTLFCNSERSYQSKNQYDFTLISTPGKVFQYNMMQKLAGSKPDSRVIAMTGLAIAGGILTGIGVILEIVGGVLIGTALREEGNYPDKKDFDHYSDHDRAVNKHRANITGLYIGGGVSIVFGILAIGAGVPMLIVGLILRAKFAASLISNDKFCLKYDAGLNFQRAYLQVRL